MGRNGLNSYKNDLSSGWASATNAGFRRRGQSTRSGAARSSCATTTAATLLIRSARQRGRHLHIAGRERRLGRNHGSDRRRLLGLRLCKVKSRDSDDGKERRDDGDDQIVLVFHVKSLLKTIRRYHDAKASHLIVGS